jgi:hypothetical protein
MFIVLLCSLVRQKLLVAIGVTHTTCMLVVAHMHQVQIFGKFFVGWREEARTSKKLKSLITQFFKICIQRLRLTPQACMAFFNVSPVNAEVLHAC